MTELHDAIKAQAYGLGFDLVGITQLGLVEGAERLDAWLAAGYAADMDYIARGAEKRHDTRLPFEGARSAIVVGMNYGGREPTGPVARYARGDDYHDVMVDRLRELHAWLDAQLGTHAAGKAYVDTGPILERELARRAGLGWFGKNTNLVNPALGSYFFIGSLFVDLELTPDAPFEADRCGSCTRCLDACPTNAFAAPRVLDATRCISYLTIENKGEIPREFHAAISEGEHLYGCDVCQEVCPWNVRFARELTEQSPYAARPAIGGKDALSLAGELMEISQESFSATFRKSSMKRAKLRGLQRNAAVLLRNTGSAQGGRVRHGD